MPPLLVADRADIRHGFGLLSSPELAAYNERKMQVAQGELKGKF